MAEQLAFYFDQRHCIGCDACQIACKDKHDLPVGQVYRRVREVVGGGFVEQDGAVRHDVYAFWLSVSCNHCLKPACVERCPTGALHKRAHDGVVLLEQAKCVGCRRCLAGCPYGAIQFDLATRKAGKCDFCHDLLAQKKPPACVAACPMRALDYGPLNQLRAAGGVSETEGLPKAELTEPALVITPHRQAVQPAAQHSTKIDYKE